MSYGIALASDPTSNIGGITSSMVDDVLQPTGIVIAMQQQVSIYASATGVLCFDGNRTDLPATANQIEQTKVWDNNAGEYVNSTSYNRTSNRMYNAMYDITYYNYTPMAYSMYDVGNAADNITTANYMVVGNITAALALARTIFDTPTNASIDIRVYTTGINDPIVTWVWENLQNAQPDTDYYIRFGVSDVTPGDGLLVANVPYNNSTYQASLTALYDALANTQQTVVDQQGYLYTTAILLHYDNGDPVTDDTYTFKITLADGNVQDEGTQSGGTIDIYINTSPSSDDTFNPDTSSSETPAAGQEMSVDNLLTSSYAISETNLRALGAWLWGGNISTLENIQTAPIENILSCKRIPFNVTGTTTTVKLGNVDTQISADKTSTTHKQTIGSLTVPVKYGDYMDYMSNISIYLPYIGIQTIPTALCYRQGMENAKNKDGNNILDGAGNVVQVPKVTGRTISVTYIFDIVYGSCCAEVAIDGITYAYFNGTCGVDIPITASNRSENELALIKQGGNIATSTGRAAISGAASGNIGGAIAGIISNFAGGFLDLKKEAVTQDTHYTTAGGMSSQIASYLPSSVLLFVEQLVYTEPTTYKHENGYPCNISLNMKTLKGLGYTELDGSIEISSIPCLEEEREGLKRALMEGFYVNTFHNKDFDVD